MKGGFVYILASSSNVIYTGVTSDLVARVVAHREGSASAFTAKYGCKRLVYYKEYPTIIEAISREKMIKGWRRSRKEELIASLNPGWIDLFDGLTGQASDRWTAIGPLECGPRADDSDEGQG